MNDDQKTNALSRVPTSPDSVRTPSAASPQAPATLPITFIGGYLGAGKTTMLNHLLRHNDGRRLAVLVNDFGDINIDADLITSYDGETMRLANGCICCTMADGFLRALGQIRARADEFDHVLIEASGVADPTKLANYAAALQYDLNGTIVLVDAEHVRERAANKYVGETVIRQIRAADLLVLNKSDLVSADELAAVRHWLRELAPDTPLIETSHGVIPPALLVGPFPDPPADAASGPSPDEPPAGLSIDHNSLYETISYTSPTPLDGDAFRRWAGALPPAIIRAKGIVHLQEDPGRPFVFQRVGRRWSLSPADRAGTDLRGLSRPLRSDSRLVLIALPGTTLPAQSDTPFGAG